MQRRARLSLLSVGIRAGLPTDRFFLCELKKHPEGELVEKAPSQAGKKSKKTNNGESAASSKKKDPLYAAQLHTYPGHTGRGQPAGQHFFEAGEGGVSE
jgi:hypothetical protein